MFNKKPMPGRFAQTGISIPGNEHLNSG